MTINTRDYGLAVRTLRLRFDIRQSELAEKAGFSRAGDSSGYRYCEFLAQVPPEALPKWM